MKTRKPARRILAWLLTLTMCLSLLPVVALAEGETTTWTKIDLADIQPTDTVAITMTTSDNTTYVLYNGNGTSSAPTAVVASVEDTTMTTADSDTLSWNITSTDAGYIIYKAGTTDTWLYSTNTNNGVRVGTNEDNVWVLDSDSGYLKHVATSRYLGVYTTNPDWRAYTNTTGNTKNQTLGFWKLGGSSDPTPGPQYAKLDNDIQNGDQLIVYYNKDSMVMGSAVSGKGLAGVAATPNGDFIQVDEGMAVLTAKAEDNGSFTFTNAEGKYLTSGATGNSLTFEDAAGDYSTWTVSAVEGGIHLVSVNAKYNDLAQALEVYNSVFTTYTEKTTAYYLFNLYTLTDEKPEGGTTPEEPGGEDTDELYKPADGDTVAIYYPNGGLVLTGTASGSKLTGSAATVEGTALLTDGSELRLNVAVDENDNYTFTSGDKYLTSGATGNSLTLADEASDYSLWKLEEATDGWYIKNVNAKYNDSISQYLEYYNGFTTYSLGSGGAIYTMQFFQNIQADNAVDSSVVESIAAWGGGGPYENDATSVHGDKYMVGDMLDSNAVYTAVVSGSAVKPFTTGTSTSTGSTSYYMGGTGLGSGTDDYMQFAVSTKGWGDMELSFRLRASNTGAGAWQLQYSTDGTNFVNFTTGEYSYGYTIYGTGGVLVESGTKTGSITDGIAKTSLNPGNYITFTFDVPTGAENADNLYIRLVPSTEVNAKGTGAPGTGGTIRIDSVVLAGSPIVADSVTGYVSVDPDGVEEDQAPGTELTMTSETEGAEIQYRFVNTATGEGDWLTYNESSKPALPELPATLEVKATSEGKADSVTRIFTYAAGTVSPVKMTPNGGGVYIKYNNTTITLSCATEGATIWYRTSPDADFAVYSLPIILERNFGSLTVEAYAVKEGFNSSSVVKRVFTEMSSEKYGIYFGQLHSHTNISDGAGSIQDAYKHASGVYNMDFLAVTDHSNSFDGTSETLNTNALETSPEWATAKEAAAAVTTKTDGSPFLGIYGFEMTWSNGLGHINTYNTAGWQSRTQTAYSTYSTALQNYYAELKTAPDSLSQFNHPGTTFGDFSDFAYYDAEIDDLITLIEVGNGEGAIGSSGYFPSYEYYTRALDKGWHVAPSNNQDNHKGNWGDANTARTVVLATSLTEEALYDAIRSYRVYATEDNDLSIYYTLDGNIMGSILDKSDVTPNAYGQYSGTVELEDPTDGNGAATVEVIVNGGLSVASCTANCNSTVNFSVPTDYSYYYIKVTQADGDIAVTAPVWIGEVEAVGISSLTAASELTVAGQEQTFNLELYNNESKALEVSSITYSINDGKEQSLTGISSVGKLSTASCTFGCTFAQDGVYTVKVTVKGTLNGVEKTYTQELRLTVMPAEVVTRIVVDGTHCNDYVTGYYGGRMGNMTTIAADNGVQVEIVRDEITADTLKDCSLLVISAPAKKSGTDNAGAYTPSTFSDDFIALVKAYVEGGGSVAICGLADYQDSGEYHSSTQLNNLLAAIGSTMSINDDEVIDNDNNGGQPFRLYPENFNMDSKWTAGIVEGQTYSQYSGCSVNPGDGTWLVRGFDTTWGADSDKDGAGVLPDKSYSYEYNGNEYTLNAVVDMGDVVFLACEETESGGTIFAAGGVFLSDFEVKAELDNIWDLPYANRTIYENLLGSLCATENVTPIADIRAAELGRVFVAEGYVTNGTANENTSFFDAIYIQDDTGGITVFPYSAEGLEVGTKVRVIGYTDAYQGDKEIQIISLRTLNEEPNVYQPKVLSTKDATDYDTYGGQLVKTSGKVSDIVLSGGVVSQFKLTDSTGVAATVFIDGYITNESGVNSIASWIRDGQTVSAVGLLYAHPEGSSDVSVPVLRVRNCDEITKVGGSSSGSSTETDPSQPTTSLPFTDVKSGSWFYEAVEYVYEAGMMNGTSDTTFAPNATTTRGMIVTILYRLENEPAAGDSGFADVDADQYYAAPVAWAAANGIVNGTSATTFSPNDPITREQMAAILYRYAQYKGYDVSGKADLSGYTDADTISAYAVDAMSWANAAGLITGVTDTTLDPTGSATRAQIATILMRFCENVAK